MKRRALASKVFEARQPSPETILPTTPVLSVQPISSTQINLSWSAASSRNGLITGYKLYKDGVFLANTTGTSYSSTGLTINTSYSFTIRAIDVKGKESLLSAPATVSTLNSYVLDVSSAVSDGGHSWKVNFDFPTPASNSADNWNRSLLRFFEDGVELGPANSLHADIRTTGAGRFSHWDNPDGQQSAESIRFSASDNGNPTSNGRVYSYLVGVDSIAPTVPTGLSATATAFNSVSISWSASTDYIGVAGYKLRRDNVVIADQTSLTFPDIGLTGETTYNYTISAYDAVGNESAQSDVVSVTTPAEPAPFVNLIVIDVNYDQATQKFTARVKNTGTAASPVDNVLGVAYYSDNVYRTWGNYGAEHSLAAGAEADLTYNGIGYTIPSGSHTIKAWIDDNNLVTESSDADNTFEKSILIESPDVTAPSVPVGLTVETLSSTSVRLTWLASTDDNSGIQGYKVYKNGTFVTNVTSGLTYDDTGLATSSTFDYQVSAYDNAGTPNESAKSNVVVGTTILLCDLIVTDVNYSTATGLFSAVIKNIGNTASPADFPLSVSYWVDGVYRTWGNYGSNYALAAGESKTVGCQGGAYTIPSGSHIIEAWVDDNNLVTEVSNTNNHYQKTITVSGVIATDLEGFAQSAGVTGGAGGASLVVTNLNSSGVGSLKAAIETAGARNITFTPGLSGTITFTNVVYIPYPDMTIDGAGANITITGYSLSVFRPSATPVWNVIIKNLTFNNTEISRNAIFIEYGSYKVWIDHCTFTNNNRTLVDTGQGIAIWDRNIGLGGLTGITISWCKWGPLNYKALLISSQSDVGDLDARVSVHHCWFDQIYSRSPRMGRMTVHMWNNYVSNWTEYGSAMSTGNLLAENNIYERNGGTAIDANYGNISAASVNASGNLLLGSPVPTIETIGTFPIARIDYSYTLETADTTLKNIIIAGAGANNG
ncbi:MAG: fibronectin type III domain-containing protein [Nitrososphaeraceae archaeon]